MQPMRKQRQRSPGLNLRAVFEPEELLSPAFLLGPLLDRLDAALTAEHIPIAHLKGIVTAPTGFVKAAVCGNGAGASG